MQTLIGLNMKFWKQNLPVLCFRIIYIVSDCSGDIYNLGFSTQVTPQHDIFLFYSIKNREFPQFLL